MSYMHESMQASDVGRDMLKVQRSGVWSLIQHQPSLNTTLWVHALLDKSCSEHNSCPRESALCLSTEVRVARAGS